MPTIPGCHVSSRRLASLLTHCCLFYACCVLHGQCIGKCELGPVFCKKPLVFILFALIHWFERHCYRQSMLLGAAYKEVKVFHKMVCGIYTGPG